jgi:hypothetical protein
MAITIGSFTCNYLTAQPYGYEGEARRGLTARTFRVSGLLSAAQWQALLNEYNTWRNARINDQDTLLSETVGTTISLTVGSANGIAVSGLACWFAEAPSGEQAGPYVQVSAILVDAAQALAVLLRQRELDKQQEQADANAVDCAVIAANLQRQKDETDCEIAALSGGLADDFAEQNATKELLTKTAELGPYTANAAALAVLDSSRELVAKGAELTAYTTNAAALTDLEFDRELVAKGAELTSFTANAAALADLASDREVVAKGAEATAYTANAAALATIDSNREVVSKGAELTAYTANADALAELDSDRELVSKSAELTAFQANAAALAVVDADRNIAAQQAELDALATRADDLATISVAREVLNKTADLAARAGSAGDLAELDLQLELQSAEAKAGVYGTYAEDLKTAEVAIEIADLTARQAIFAAGGLDSLKTLRSFQALIDKYLSEDLPDLGTESLGGVSIKLSKPVVSRSNGPTVSTTAGGFSLIQGPLVALEAKSIEGYVTTGSVSDLMSWYDSAIAAAGGAGTWFPTRPPTITGAESVLVAGVKTTRYTVSAEVAKLV